MGNRAYPVQSYIYELPFGPDKPYLQTGFGRWVLGGWQVNGVLTLQTGPPLAIRISSRSLVAPGNGNRPDLAVTGKPEITGLVGRRQKWIEKSNFAPPAAETFGNLGRNILSGPGIVNFDFSLFRNFDITENTDLQLRIESFNFTNTPQYVNPNTNFSSGSFGEVTRTAPNLSDPRARRFQIGLRLTF